MGERTTLSKEGRCFKCKQKGHRIVDCPLPNTTTTTTVDRKKGPEVAAMSTSSRIEEVTSDEDLNYFP